MRNHYDPFQDVRLAVCLGAASLLLHLLPAIAKVVVETGGG